MGAPRSPQKASPKRESSTLKDLFDSEPYTNSPIRNTPITTVDLESEKLLSNLSCCTFVFTFTDPTESPYQQDLKRLKLLQILSSVKSFKPSFSDDHRILLPLFNMISTNLFRDLPPPSNPIPTVDSILLDDENDPTSSSLHPAWAHLHVVYEILHRLVQNIDPKTLHSYVHRPFLLSLLSLFQTEDRRERESLKSVYHRIYLKFTFHRSFMRKTMKDVFLQYVDQTDRHCGIGELLEIWGSIINGFNAPLKEEHKVCLMKILLPMHKPKGMQLYHRQLAYCISQFVQKEPMLGGVVIRTILKCWPVTNCQKEVLLIGEVEELLEYMDNGQIGRLALPLCNWIARCMNSWNSQVAERALYVWNNERFVRMASEVKESAFPVVVESIEKNINWHWSKIVRQLTVSVKEMLEEMEPKLYSKCLQDVDQREAIACEKEMKRKENWEKLEMAATKNNYSVSN